MVYPYDDDGNRNWHKQRDLIAYCSASLTYSLNQRMYKVVAWAREEGAGKPVFIPYRERTNDHG